MRKVYTFKQLREKAKKKAAEEVHEKEGYTGYDGDIHYRMIVECLEAKLEEFQLDFEGISWNNRYGTASLDLDSVEISEEFLKKFLTKEELAIIEDFENVTAGQMEHKLFDADYECEGYVLEVDCDDFDEQEAIEFLNEYSDDDFIKDMYKFHTLLGGELLSEELSELFTQVNDLITKMKAPIENKLNELCKKLYEELERIVNDSCDYYDSVQYWYDALEAESYPHEDYLFNYQGEIILKDFEFVEVEYEDIYLDNAA